MVPLFQSVFVWEDYAEASRLKKCEAELQKGISQAKDKAPVESSHLNGT